MYKVKEEDIKRTIDDFEVFCTFIKQHDPVLSVKKAELGKYDLFKLNSMLYFKRDVKEPKFLQKSYPIINMIFQLAVKAKLFIRKADSNGKIHLVSTREKIEYDGLNPFEKYTFLFETFWINYDLTTMLSMGFLKDNIEKMIRIFSKSIPGKILKKGDLWKYPHSDYMFSLLSDMILFFNYFGFNDYVPVIEEKKFNSKHDDRIESVAPTILGINVCKILVKHSIFDWNLPWLNQIYTGDIVPGIAGQSDPYFFDRYENEEEMIIPEYIPLREYLKPVFPEGVLMRTVTSVTDTVINGNLIFKVSLSKSIWRKIAIAGNCSLEDLHEEILHAFDFRNDHLYAFFTDGKKEFKNAIYSPEYDEGPFANEITIGELDLFIGKKILYLFDFGDSWQFEVKLIEIKDSEPLLKRPEILESKGEAPKQYIWDDTTDEE